MVFVFFLFCLIHSVPEKFKNLIFKIPIFPQTLNINNQRTTSAKSINVNIFTDTVFEIFVFEIRSVLWAAQRGTGSETVKFSVKNKKKSIVVDIARNVIDLQA